MSDIPLVEQIIQMSQWILLRLINATLLTNARHEKSMLQVACGQAFPEAFPSAGNRTHPLCKHACPVTEKNYWQSCFLKSFSRACNEMLLKKTFITQSMMGYVSNVTLPKTSKTNFNCKLDISLEFYILPGERSHSKSISMLISTDWLLN